MLFNSQIFLFVFLPLVLIGWYTINYFKLYKFALCFLSGMSLWFYGYFNPSYLVILIVSVVLNYSVSLFMEKCSRLRKFAFYFGLFANLAILGYFKYYDFFVENINAVFKSSFALKHIILPLGISFFTLQQVSFIIDRYWEIAPHYDVIDYVAYVTFFPQLIAGPIVFHNEIIPQYHNIELRKFDKECFRDGLTLFTLGLAKKVLVADLFAYVVNYGFEKIYYIDTPSAWIIGLAYTIELYFDFSGYCDMACGIGKMFRFELPINFKSPYKAYSIPDYWSRWHITLTRFFTTYIYNPMMLKGVRKKKRKLYSYITPMVVFLVSGFWHGASWTFIMWGILMGIATIWCHRRFWKISKKFRWVSWLGTFVFIVIDEAIFRSETMDNMVRILRGMFSFKYTGFMVELAGSLQEELIIRGFMELMSGSVSWQMLNWLYFALMIIIFAFATLILKGKNAHEILAFQKEEGYTVRFSIFISIILAWSVISLSQVSTFLYFNF